MLKKIYVLFLVLLCFIGYSSEKELVSEDFTFETPLDIVTNIVFENAVISKEDAQELLLEKLENKLEDQSYILYCYGIDSVNGIAMYGFELRYNSSELITVNGGSYYVDCITSRVYEHKINHDRYNEIIELK